MKVGVQINRFDYPDGSKSIGSTLAEIAQAADVAAFDSIWVMDHFFQLEPMLGPASDPMLEAYTTLGYLAGITNHAKLGTMVSGVIYREPALLIKAVTTLDVLSGGRAYFGIGAGWYEEEAKALGFMNPLTSNRFERLEEILEIAQMMFSDETAPYNGQHYQMEKAMNHPQPLSQPHPPILIGGGGEQKTLRLVAQYGDACNLFASLGPDGLRHKLDVLRKYCDELGRDYEAIEKTALVGYDVESASTNPEEFITSCKAIAELGISHAIMRIGTVHTAAPFEQFAKKVLPQLKEI